MSMEIALERIRKNKETKVINLDLSDLSFSHLPEELSDCDWLEQLKIQDNNKLLDLSPLSGLQNLQKLYCSTTRVSDLSPLSGLLNLKELNCDTTQVSDLSPLSRLQNLQKLYCSITKVSDLNPLSGLLNLKELNCDTTNVNDLSPLRGLQNLQLLSCSSTQVHDLSPLRGLQNLQLLSCASTQVSDLSPLRGLQRLKVLWCSFTQVSDLGPLRGLQSLEVLRCNSTQVSDLNCLSAFIEKGIEIVFKGYAGSQEFDFKDCPLTNPPLEIAQQGNAAILKYFADREKQGAEKLYEAKVVVVGAGESGKTTLIQKLLDPTHPVPNPADKRTEGIRVTTYPFQGEVKGNTTELTAYLWDFGGQELYHATHQFFLTPDTLYILLNDNRKNDTDFYYWLNIVRLRAGDKCPILTVFNAKDKSPRQIMPGEELYNAFPGVVKTPVDIDFADQNFQVFEQLQKHVESHFSNLEVLGRPYPALWVKAREALSQLKEEHISWSKFQELCQNEGVKDEESIRILAKTLHNLGVLLYFPEVFGLENLVILQPQWCIDAIYKAFDLESIDKNQGRFSERTLAECWSNDNRFSGLSLQLLRLMQQFDLCYPVEGTRDEFIAPQLLPLEENRLPDFPHQQAIHFRYEYTFMPAGMISSLIARMSRHIKAPFVWRNGVTLAWEEGTVAEVSEQAFSRQINIKVAGPERQRRLDDIRKNLQEIHRRFRGLKYEEKVACNCGDCAGYAEPTLFEFKELEDNAQYNDDMICRNGSRKKIPAKHILEGIAYQDNARIFISYAHQNEALKDEFRTMIRPLERNGDWKVWDDRWLLPGDDWNREIMRQLSEANVIVLMLTAQFFNSDFIYDIELSRAIQRHESGDALLIGIIVDHCLWEETPLRKIQMLPKDAKPVIGSRNRSEIWKSVAEIIKKTIAAREERYKRRDW